MEESKKPALRFRGFTEDWEEGRLEDLAKVKDSARISNRLWTKAGVPYIRASDISSDDLSGVLFLAEETYEKYKAVTGAPAKEDVLFNGGGEIGKAVLKRDDSPVYVQGGAVLYVQTSKSNQLNGEFLKTYFETKAAQHYMEIASAGGTMKHFTLGPAQNMPICFPSGDEQKKLGNSIHQINSLILENKRQYEKLQTLKKSCIEKMFPQNEKDIPEIRFGEFSAHWKHNKAQRLFIETIDKGHPDLPVLSATQDRGMIRRDENSIHIFHDKKNEEGYKRIFPGQFVVHLRSFQGGFAHSEIEGITSPAYTVFGFVNPEEHDDKFWKYVFTSKAFIRRLETVTYGIRDGRSISYEEFLGLTFQYPEKAEQEKIARYLDTLSKAIDLHQCQLEKLQNLKKSLLDKMFV